MTKIMILNGFDRCGSTAISRTLSSHPEIEVLFQPFNSGSIRKKMYKVMDNIIASAGDVKFFSELEQGRLWQEYIVSQWFEKYSTTLNIKPGRLHILKTTINHFTIKWLQDMFPVIEFWGIWRDPVDILASLLRNGFYSKWYTDDLPQIEETLKKNTEFPSIYLKSLKSVKGSETRALALLIAARSYFFFKYLEPGKLISYENFVSDPDAELSKICSYYKLHEHAFHNLSDKNLNLTGAKYIKGKSYRHLISREDDYFIGELFGTLYELIEHRFGPGNWQNINTADGETS